MKVITEGEKVPASAAALLGKLNIKPFAYGLEVTNVYDGGDFYNAAVLEIKDEDLEDAVAAGIQQIAALCLAAGYPTLCSVLHSLINAYKDNVLALGVMLEEYSFPQVRHAVTHAHHACVGGLQTLRHVLCRLRRPRRSWPIRRRSRPRQLLQRLLLQMRQLPMQRLLLRRIQRRRTWVLTCSTRRACVTRMHTPRAHRRRRGAAAMSAGVPGCWGVMLAKDMRVLLATDMSDPGRHCGSMHARQRACLW
jgi:hypothetical protein